MNTDNNIEKVENCSSLLKDLRELVNLPQVEFAHKFNIPLQTYSQWETGRRNPPDYVIEMISKIIEQELSITALTNHGKNIGWLSDYFRHGLASIGCPIPVLDKVRIVKSEDECGTVRYHITAGDIAEKYIKPMKYWLQQNVDSEYEEAFADLRAECDSSEELDKLCFDMTNKVREPFFERYEKLLKDSFSKHVSTSDDD